MDTTTKKPTSKKFPVVLPCIKGVSEQIRRLFKQYDIPAYFMAMNTLRHLLVRPQEKILKDRVVGPAIQVNKTIVESSVFGA